MHLLLRSKHIAPKPRIARAPELVLNEVSIELFSMYQFRCPCNVRFRSAMNSLRRKTQKACVLNVLSLDSRPSCCCCCCARGQRPCCARGPLSRWRAAVRIEQNPVLAMATTKTPLTKVICL
jgi:hypothetical protein